MNKIPPEGQESVCHPVGNLLLTSSAIDIYKEIYRMHYQFMNKIPSERQLFQKPLAYMESIGSENFIEDFLKGKP